MHKLKQFDGHKQHRRDAQANGSHSHETLTTFHGSNLLISISKSTNRHYFSTKIIIIVMLAFIQISIHFLSDSFLFVCLFEYYFFGFFVVSGKMYKLILTDTDSRFLRLHLYASFEMDK